MNNYIPPVTKNILIINAVLFGLKYLNVLGINLDILLAAFYPQSPNFKLYQVITHMFMHANFMHFLFNMYAVYMFGAMIEQSIGAKKYLILYFVSGLGGFLLFNLVNYFEFASLLKNVHALGIDTTGISEYAKLDIRGGDVFNQINANYSSWINSLSGVRQSYIEPLEKLFVSLTVPMMGASGAIFGLLVVFAVLYPDLRLMFIFLPVPIKAKYMVVGYIIIELLLGIQANAGDNVAHFAHLGGALFGYLLIKHWMKSRFTNN
ncbi:MAG: rhomboid family intramembrane serine protease [Flavobacteriales bacterium]|nr:rhomboid family intramembrane serine protease [Flavobacteriales bacterium]